MRELSSGTNFSLHHLEIRNSCELGNCLRTEKERALRGRYCQNRNCCSACPTRARVWVETLASNCYYKSIYKRH